MPLWPYCSPVSNDKRLACSFHAMAQKLHDLWQLNDTQQLSVGCAVLMQTTRPHWRHQKTLWRQRHSPDVTRHVCRPMLVLTAILCRNSPDTPRGTQHIQLTVTMARYDVHRISQSLHENAFSDWTECVGGVCPDDGALGTDDVYNVVHHCYAISHIGYNKPVQAAIPTKCFRKGGTNTNPNTNTKTNPDPSPNPLHYLFSNVGIAVVGIAAAFHNKRRTIQSTTLSWHWHNGVRAYWLCHIATNEVSNTVSTTKKKLSWRWQTRATRLEVSQGH